MPLAIARRMDRRPVATGALLAIVAFVFFGVQLHRTRPFVDEWAYFAQSYYLDLFLDGPSDARQWLEYPAIDLPPLPKYLIGFALRAIQQERPGPAASWAWYQDTSRSFASEQVLNAARWPSVVLGAIGVFAIFLLGRQVGGVAVGLLAGLFLMLGPLYSLHARRAMADVPTEALVLCAAVAALAAWSRTIAGKGGALVWALFVSAGVFAGLAVEAKLSGALALIVIGVWTTLGCFLPGVTMLRRLMLFGGLLITSMIAFAVFVALNPTLTVHPKGPLPAEMRELEAKSIVGRALEVAAFRSGVSDQARQQFPHNALNDPLERVKVVIVQGLGRHGPFGPSENDSRVRYDWRQDGGALVWGPLVFLGYAFAFICGLKEQSKGVPPLGWALCLMGLTTFGVVAWFIPLAWDRYLLPIQASNAVLASLGLVWGLRSLRSRFAGAPS